MLKYVILFLETYGRETRYLTTHEKRNCRVYENRELSRTLNLREGNKGNCRELHELIKQETEEKCAS